MKYFLLAFLLLNGCASRVIKQLDVSSDPIGAQIEVGGITLGQTPTTIQITCEKKWVGLMFSPDGWETKGSLVAVTAYPPTAAKGSSQVKIINACEYQGTKNAQVFFDMNLNEVRPIERIQIQTTSDKK